jgi:hypothetical protein
MNQHTLSAARSSLPDEEHERLRGLLPEYAMIRLSGCIPDPELQAITAHVSTCADCRDELEELCKLLVDTATGNLPSSTIYPPLDISSLTPRLTPTMPADPPPSRINVALERTASALHQVILQFTEDIVAAFRWLDPAGSFRGALHSSYQHPTQHPDDLHIAIDISPMDASGARCRVIATVVDPRDPFAQGGHSVTLRYGTVVDTQISDHRGCVAFVDIPSDALPNLQFTIVPHAPDDANS